MKNRPHVGVAVIVVKDGKVLLGKRKNSHGAGTWQFPGGHLEFNESIEACARREVFEETGIKIKNIRLGPYTNDIFHEEQKHYITLFVIAKYDSGRLTLKEPEKCDAWNWFEWSHLPEPSFLPILNLQKQNFSLHNVRENT
jgi:8-oxo-dGTP diphosphatase